MSDLLKFRVYRGRREFPDKDWCRTSDTVFGLKVVPYWTEMGGKPIRSRIEDHFNVKDIDLREMLEVEVEEEELLKMALTMSDHDMGLSMFEKHWEDERLKLLINRMDALKEDQVNR